MTLHLVSFQIPYPADYGGVIEVFYKLKALKQADVMVILHCFQYKDRKPSPILERYASKVYYYPRTTGLKSQFSFLPYIVASRKSDTLIQNLLLDDYPILLEGLHTCYLLRNPLFANRKIFVRTHNIEHRYYMKLALASGNIIKKTYYFIEAVKLKFFETNLSKCDKIFAISQTDATYFKKKFPTKDVRFLPCFFDNTPINIDAANLQTAFFASDYILFNADLSVVSNVKVALFIIDKVMPSVNKDIRLIIAGRNPMKKLLRAVENKPNIELLSNVEQNKMNSLVANARINLLLSFDGAGVKLKLLNTLLHSQGHCLANDTMLQGTDLFDVCPTANDFSTIAEAINRLYFTTPTMESLSRRLMSLSSSGYINSVAHIVNS